MRPESKELSRLLMETSAHALPPLSQLFAPYLASVLCTDSGKIETPQMPMELSEKSQAHTIVSDQTDSMTSGSNNPTAPIASICNSVCTTLAMYGVVVKFSDEADGCGRYRVFGPHLCVCCVDDRPGTHIQKDTKIGTFLFCQTESKTRRCRWCGRRGGLRGALGCGTTGLTDDLTEHSSNYRY